MAQHGRLVPLWVHHRWFQPGPKHCPAILLNFSGQLTLPLLPVIASNLPYFSNPWSHYHLPNFEQSLCLQYHRKHRSYYKGTSCHKNCNLASFALSLTLSPCKKKKKKKSVSSPLAHNCAQVYPSLIFLGTIYCQLLFPSSIFNLSPDWILTISI